MFSIIEINNVINGIIHYNNNEIINNISINSNSISSNTLFIPIIGKKYDGNIFIPDAIKNGSIACLISSNYTYKSNIIKLCRKKHISLIEVKNTTISLQLLGHYNRIKNKDTFLIGITGSNGKTTSKEIIYNVLKHDYNVLKTEDNLNNIIGVSLTLLKLNKHDICIVELGMNHIGEISKLSKMCIPNLGIITNIGSAHIGNLGSINNILKAKLEIMDGFNDKSTLLLNKSDKLLRKIKGKNIDYYSTKSMKIGEYDRINKDLALKIASLFNINNPNKYIDEFIYPKMRNETIILDDKLIISDCYNANYESMSSGIYNILSKYKNKHIILFLGEIKEIGSFSKYYHNKIGKMINKSTIDILYLFGKDTVYIKEKIKNKNIKVKNYNNSINELYNDLYKYSNSIIYFKGSRSNKLELIIEELKSKINRS